MNLKQIIDAIVSEMARAQEKFPEWPTDPVHAAAILGEEFGELQQAILEVMYEPSKSTRDHVRTEAIQTAAMTLRFLLSLHKYDYTPASQHRQNDGV